MIRQVFLVVQIVMEVPLNRVRGGFMRRAREMLEGIDLDMSRCFFYDRSYKVYLLLDGLLINLLKI